MTTATETTVDLSVIARKIQALLALGNSPNENEAIAALAKAQALMMQYGIQLDSINTGETCFVREYVSEGQERIFAWKENLIAVIARCNFCQPIVAKHVSLSGKRSTTGRFVYIGKPHHVQIAKQMTEYLVETSLRLADEEAKRQKKRDPRFNTRQFKPSFLYGIATRLCERLNERFEAMQSQGVPEANISALACRTHIQRELDELNAFISGRNIEDRKRGAVYLDFKARDLGREAGDKISLNSQVSAATANLPKMLNGAN